MKNRHDAGPNVAFTTFLRKHSWIALLCCAAFLVSAAFDLQPVVTKQRRLAQIKMLVKIGDDIDQAAKTLRQAGFQVGTKYKPTASEDCYWVDIEFVEKTPLIIGLL